MGDLDNAPMPPMGADNMGMDDPMNNDPMGGGEPPMDDQQPPMDDDMGGEDSENAEINNVINGMNLNNKLKVLNYAKSIEDDSNDMPQDGGIPMESTFNYKGIIDEVINDVLDDYEGTKRPEDTMPKEYRSQPITPFQSPNFK